ncbi:MAG TPA: AraC family transcriptional regulator [Polyangiaceae bacterium]
MDLMSQAMETLRLRTVQFRRHDLGGHLPALSEKNAGLYLIEQGGAAFDAGDARLGLQAGDLLLLPRPLSRKLTPRGTNRARLLSGEFDFAAPDHPLLAALPATIHVAEARLRTTPHWREHVSSLAAELCEPREGSSALVTRLTEVLIIHAMRLSPPPPRAECPNSGWLRGLHDELIKPALGAMHGAPGHAWTIARLAQLSGQSRSAFAAHFASVMGEPPMSYLVRWRMFRARLLLRESELPLSAIAEQVGYGSAAAFSLAFSREHGVSPGAFRAEAQRKLAPDVVAYRTAEA